MAERSIPLSSLESSFRVKISLQQAVRDGKEGLVKQILDRLTKKTAERTLNAKDSEGFSAMHYAARFNRFEIMQRLVTHPSGSGILDPNVKTDDKLTPLHFAARYTPRYLDESAQQQEEQSDDRQATSSVTKSHLTSSKKVMQLLVHYSHCEINVQDRYGITPLQVACSRGNVRAIEVLLAAKAIDIHIADNHGDTPLHEACLSGDKEIVQKLLEMEGIDLLKKNDENRTPLHLACLEGHTDIVKIMMLKGFDKKEELVSAADNELNTPLHLACESGNEKVVETLLVNGADVFALKINEISPIHVAARQGFINVARILLQGGETIVNILDVFQQSPLHYAAKNNQSDMIRFLMENGADIEALDKNSFTPLMTAAFYGQESAFQVLMEDHWAAIDVVDKNGRSPVFLAAEENRTNILRLLVKNKVGHKLCHSKDSKENTPLHIASKRGFMQPLKVLLQTDTKLDLRNEEGKTPIHLAAESGFASIVRELIRHQHNTIEDVDEDGNTPLHLACTNGHYDVANVLIEEGADVDFRNEKFWTPIDCAASKGWDRMVDLLIESEAEIDPADKSNVTPLHLACKEGHLEVVQTLMKNKASVSNLDQNKKNCLELAIDGGHEDIAMAIVKGPQWEAALRNCSSDNNTPMRKLIRKMPAVAEEVFNKCTHTNVDDSRIHSAHDDYAITFNYEFLEDYQDADPKKGGSIFNPFSAPNTFYVSDERSVVSSDDDQLSHTDLLAADALTLYRDRGGYSTHWGPKGYSPSNHALAVMAESERTQLLLHPLVRNLLDRKWRLGQWVYYTNLFFYVLFLIFLTAYALVVHHPNDGVCQVISRDSCNCFSGLNQPSECSVSALSEKFIVGNTSVVCSENNCTCLCDSEEFLTSEVFAGTDDTRVLSSSDFYFVDIGSTIVIILAFVRLLFEAFQLFKTHYHYFLDWVNWLEVFMYILSITFCVSYTVPCRCLQSWQWQVGVVAVFLAWIVLIVFVRKLPFVGIYVLMFIDILKTFFRMVILTVLLVVAFGLAFYMLFIIPGSIGRTPFDTAARSILKTMTMTTGEFEFDTIFRQQGEEGEPNIQFPYISYFFWIVFLILMPILLTNLLVGLAVDDIKAIQQEATLKRLALKVNLALSVEQLMPDSLRRKLIIKEHQVKPNRKPNPYQWFRYEVLKVQRAASAELVENALNPPIEPIEQVQKQTGRLMKEMSQVRGLISDLSERNRKLESLITQLASKSGISEYSDYNADPRRKSVSPAPDGTTTKGKKSTSTPSKQASSASMAIPEDDVFA